MIARRQTMIFYLVVGVILGSGLVSLPSFSPVDQPLYISNSEAGPPSQSLTSPTHLIESESTATGAISADTLQGHSQATASTPSEQPAPTLVFTHQVAGPIQAPVLVAHNPTHVRTGPGVGYALLTRKWPLWSAATLTAPGWPFPPPEAKPARTGGSRPRW